MDADPRLASQIGARQYDSNTFQLTSKLLRINPEYYTVWNIRRRCLISGSFSKQLDGSSPSKASPNSLANATLMPSSGASSPSSSTAIPQDHGFRTIGRTGTIPSGDADTESNLGLQRTSQISNDIRSELAFTVPLLLKFPKCYWIWNYRLWVLHQANTYLDASTTREFWEEELGLLGKMLNRDRRNFHAWTYRRFVVAQLESAALGGQSMAESEFEYTTTMITDDLSNFSAWHNRSQLILPLLAGREADQVSREAFFNKGNFLQRPIS